MIAWGTYAKLGVISGVGAVLLAQSSDESHMKAQDSNEELRQRLLARLGPVRAGKLSNPKVRFGQGKDGRMRLSFSIAHKSMALRVLSTVAFGLSDDKQKLFTTTTNDAGEVSVIFDDRSGSFVVSDSELVFFKEGHVSDQELDAFVSGYATGAFGLGSSQNGGEGILAHRPQDNRGKQEISQLESLGAIVYDPKVNSTFDWSCLAGADDIRREIEDTILLGLEYPDKFDAITKQTRERFESNCPRAILFEGPPGVGKTLACRVIAAQAGVPLVYVPVESVMSKYYGESESRLSEILQLCNSLGQSIVFIDEIDSLATSRDVAQGGSSMHEATRRILSVLLRALDGFQGQSKSVLVAATNRKQDLDAALLSRFDVSIRFPLPSTPARVSIFARYAKHLSSSELDNLAQGSRGLSGRDIKDLCKHAERRWVSYCIRANQSQDVEKPPALSFYLDALNDRLSSQNSSSTQDCV